MAWQIRHNRDLLRILASVNSKLTQYERNSFLEGDQNWNFRQKPKLKFWAETKIEILEGDKKTKKETTNSKKEIETFWRKPKKWIEQWISRLIIKRYQTTFIMNFIKNKKISHLELTYNDSQTILQTSVYSFSSTLVVYKHFHTFI